MINLCDITLACQLFVVTSAKQVIPNLWAADAWGNTAFCRDTQNLHYFTAGLVLPTSSLFALFSLSSSPSRIRCGFVDSNSCFNSHSVTYFLNSQSQTFELLAWGLQSVVRLWRSPCTWIGCESVITPCLSNMHETSYSTGFFHSFGM